MNFRIELLVKLAKRSYENTFSTNTFNPSEGLCSLFDFCGGQKSK